MFSVISSVQSQKLPRPAVPLGPVFISQVVFSYTGADQSYAVPTNAAQMTVQCWGAGGASKGEGGIGGHTHYPGGGGGYTTATLSVSVADTLRIVVGQGGLTNTSASLGSTYGGGGGSPLNGDSNWMAASGGGRSALQIIGLVTGGVYDDVITAAGGGAGGTSYDGYNGTGGAGGGATGAAGAASGAGGKGGTQSAGGAAGTGGTPTNLTTPMAGSKYQGGAGGTYACGGGGGYYGGGGASSMAGGGGGSSFCLASRIASGTATLTSGSSPAVANNAGLPSGYPNTIGNGGAAQPSTGANSGGFAGQNGLVVVTFFSLAPA